MAGSDFRGIRFSLPSAKFCMAWVLLNLVIYHWIEVFEKLIIVIPFPQQSPGGCYYGLHFHFGVTFNIHILYLVKLSVHLCSAEGEGRCSSSCVYVLFSQKLAVQGFALWDIIEHHTSKFWGFVFNHTSQGVLCFLIMTHFLLPLPSLLTLKMLTQLSPLDLLRS